MAKTNRRTIPFGTYNAGTFKMPAITLGQPSTMVEIAVTATALPDTTQTLATIGMEGSDDGATWDDLGGGTLTGEPFIDRSGAVATERFYRVPFGVVKPATYQFRATVTLNQRLTTGARLTVY